MPTKSKVPAKTRAPKQAQRQNTVSDSVLGPSAVASKNDVDKTAQDAVEGNDEQKGYGGTGDLASGKVNSDPTQATDQQIKERS